MLSKNNIEKALRRFLSPNLSDKNKTMIIAAAVHCHKVGYFKEVHSSSALFCCHCWHFNWTCTCMRPYGTMLSNLEFVFEQLEPNTLAEGGVFYILQESDIL